MTKDEALIIVNEQLGYIEGLMEALEPEIKLADTISVEDYQRLREQPAQSEYMVNEGGTGTVLRKHPAQEPVGWMDSEGRFRLDFKTEIVRSISAVNKEIPLYTHPAPSWQGLSDDEISKVIIDEQIPVRTGKTANRFARAIEQAIKEKNNV